MPRKSFFGNDGLVGGITHALYTNDRPSKTKKQRRMSEDRLVNEYLCRGAMSMCYVHGRCTEDAMCGYGRMLIQLRKDKDDGQ